MAQEEKYGTRDRTYSAWHRRMSTRRFVGIESAQTLAMIDLDASLYVEYDDGTKEPLALVETAVDVGQPYKPATVTKKLARRANLEAWVVLYTVSDDPNPADPTWPDIRGFRVRRVYPEPETTWARATPAAWCKRLVQIRRGTASRLDDELDKTA